jgi:hypothetical protein
LARFRAIQRNAIFHFGLHPEIAHPYIRVGVSRCAQAMTTIAHNLSFIDSCCSMTSDFAHRDSAATSTDESTVNIFVAGCVLEQRQAEYKRLARPRAGRIRQIRILMATILALGLVASVVSAGAHYYL